MNGWVGEQVDGQAGGWSSGWVSERWDERAGGGAREREEITFNRNTFTWLIQFSVTSNFRVSECPYIFAFK